MNGFSAPRIRLCGGRSIQVSFECGAKAVRCRRVGSRAAWRRHQPTAQLSYDFFPTLNIVAGARGVEALEDEVTGLGPNAVTAETVAIDHGPVWDARRIGSTCQ